MGQVDSFSTIGMFSPAMIYGSRYSRVDQVKFVEDSLCGSQILLGPFLNILTHMKIDSNQFINTKMIYNNLKIEISVVPQLHSITSCDRTSNKFNVGKSTFSKNKF